MNHTTTNSSRISSLYSKQTTTKSSTGSTSASPLQLHRFSAASPPPWILRLNPAVWRFQPPRPISLCYFPRTAPFSLSSPPLRFSLCWDRFADTSSLATGRIRERRLRGTRRREDATVVRGRTLETQGVKMGTKRKRVGSMRSWCLECWSVWARFWALFIWIDFPIA